MGARLTLVLCGLLLPGAADAGAQARTAAGGPDGRVRISLNAGYQTTETSFEQTRTFEEYYEQGSLSLSRTVPAAPVYNAGVMVRVWRGLEFGLAGSYLTDTGGGAVTAQMPHPFYFDRDRTISGEADRVDRTETAGHVQIGWMLPITNWLEITLSAGPTVVVVEQAFVTSVAYTDSYPFDTAAFDGAVTERVRDTAVGYNAALDLTWRFSSHFGLGGEIRYSRATEDLEPSGGDPVSIRTGGLHAGGGIRLVF
jgi:hypothetical protein